MRIYEVLTADKLVQKLEISGHGEYYVITVPVDKIFKTESAQVRIIDITASVPIDPESYDYEPLLVRFDLESYNESVRLTDDDILETNIKKYLIRFGFPSAVIEDMSWDTVGGSSDLQLGLLDAHEVIDYLRKSLLSFFLTHDITELLLCIKEVPTLINIIDQRTANKFKTDIIKFCLNEFKIGEAQTAITIIKALKKIGINWPEFAAMEKSARAISSNP